jgi:hypothetical protein
MARTKGWRMEPARHSLAAKGIETRGLSSKVISRLPTKLIRLRGYFSGEDEPMDESYFYTREEANAYKAKIKKDMKKQMKDEDEDYDPEEDIEFEIDVVKVGSHPPGVSR